MVFIFLCISGLKPVILPFFQFKTFNVELIRELFILRIYFISLKLGLQLLIRAVKFCTSFLMSSIIFFGDFFFTNLTKHTKIGVLMCSSVMSR